MTNTIVDNPETRLLAETLQEGLVELGLPALTGEQLERFSTYYEFLLKYNKQVNLTRIVAAKEVAILHYLDSLTIQMVHPLTPGLRVIDIGSGAGFPGVPLLILQPQLKLSLLDAREKRLEFLRQLLERLHLSAELLHSRGEEAAHDPKYRSRFDLALARAVAPLPQLLEICLPFLRQGGNFCALKGPAADRELTESARALNRLGAVCSQRLELRLPAASGESVQRSLLLLHQEKTISAIYPRSAKEIKEKPL